MKPKLLDSLGCNQSIYTEIYFFLLADMFKSARNRVSDRKYKLGDINSEGRIGLLTGLLCYSSQVNCTRSS